MGIQVSFPQLFPFPDLSDPGNELRSLAFSGRFFTFWATREAPNVVPNYSDITHSSLYTHSYSRCYPHTQVTHAHSYVFKYSSNSDSYPHVLKYLIWVRRGQEGKVWVSFVPWCIHSAWWCFQTVVLEKTLESLLDSKNFKPVIPKGNHPEYSLEGLMLKLKLQYFGHLMWRVYSLEKTLMLEGLRTGGEGGDRGWDGWMASST